MTRDELLESLLVERFGPPRRIASERRPKLVPVEEIVPCAGCGRMANANLGCPTCRRRRAAEAAS